jgi:proline dehydrogenase
MTTIVRALILWLTGLPPVRAVITGTGLGKRLSYRFVAGDTLEEGMAAAQALHQQGIASMQDHLGENVDSAAQAAAAADGYIGALKRIRESPELDCNISVKLTQLGLDASVDLCMENMQRVLEAATNGERPILVMIDMEASEYVGRTIDVYMALRDRFPAIGVALQSYLHRTAEDVRRIAGPKAVVRMVKGAYLEPSKVAYQRLRDIRRSFGHLSAALLASGATVHFATHDERVIDSARRFVRSRSIPRARYEFQMLYGIRRDLQSSLVAGGEPVRVYIPYGTSWYPYLTRRLAERPANIWFFLSNVVRR